MAKTPVSPTSSPRLCPTCGTRVGESATKCLVCGSDLTGQRAGFGGRARAFSSPLSAPRPGVPLPLLGVGLVLVLLVGGVVALASSGIPIPFINPATPTVTPTPTVPPTFTPLPTATETPQPTATPLPPVEYTVVQNDTCIGLASSFNVSVQSITELNNLPPACNTLYVGQKLMIPQPTPTPSPLPSATLSAAEATAAACEKVTYTVQPGDALSRIAANYNVDINALMAENGILDPASVFSGQVLSIPLCARLPTPGPTPTHTPLPPYASPSLLLPQDGAAFTAKDETVSLQWTSVAVLRDNEFYQVTVEDVTAGTAKRLQEITRSTNFTVPMDFRPAEAVPHVFRWSVVSVRQVGTSSSGKTLYEPAGGTSLERTFSWYGAGP